jgi:hypothetical protein
LNQLKHCKFNVHTGNLESYHNLHLVYAPKRIAYSYSGMVLRTILAVLDHNNNVGREVVGERVRYNKVSKRYFLGDQYAAKSSQWRTDLVNKIVDFTKNPSLIEFNPDVEELLFPFPIPKNIAVGVPKPTIQELREEPRYRAKTQKTTDAAIVEG